ncbi:MAG: amidase, partial [Chloroflexota bacterium]
MTITELQQKIAEGLESARSITEGYLSQIEALDKQGPAVNAIIELNPDALAIADALDKERETTGIRGPLHGIPILLKDNIDTADKMMTTAGSLALIGSIADQDAFLVQQLRQAGAIILGKTNLSEWANFRSSRSTSGWSSRGGQTRNPYILDRNPCGSSSGSAVAVAANFCAGAIGTETDGSIVCPASFNGIVGVKPTLGLISRSGIIPIAHSQDTAGPMTRTVQDAAILLGALTGDDPQDNATQESEGNAYTDYTQFLDKNGLQGARIGVARNYFGRDERVDAIITQAIETMKQLGAEIVDPANLDISDQLEKTEYEVLLYEFKADLNQYLAGLGPNAPVRSIDDVIAFNEQHRDRVMPFFEQEEFLQAQKKGSLTDEGYLQALQANHRLTRTEGIDKTMDTYQLDAIVAPTNGPSHLTDLVTGNGSVISSSSSAAVAGYPNITVPAGYIHGLPVGISFLARAYQEPALLKFAFAFEQETQIRQAPQFLPTAKLLH